MLQSPENIWYIKSIIVFENVYVINVIGVSLIIKENETW